MSPDTPTTSTTQPLGVECRDLVRLFAVRVNDDTQGNPYYLTRGIGDPPRTGCIQFATTWDKEEDAIAAMERWAKECRDVAFRRVEMWSVIEVPPNAALTQPTDTEA